VNVAFYNCTRHDNRNALSFKINWVFSEMHHDCGFISLDQWRHHIDFMVHNSRTG